MNGRLRNLCIVTLSALFLASCDVMDKLGFDTYDYMSETVTLVHGGDSEEAEIVRSLLSILITDSVVLPEFLDMGEAIEKYRDAVLTEMLQKGYSKYSGNVELMKKAAEAYPEYQITQMIPDDDFEATMYESFGGDVKITHRDGVFFRYLKKIGAYVCSVLPKDSGISTEILSVEESERTYRVRFRCVSEEEVGDVYFALIIKRADGTHYIKKLFLDGGE